MKKQTQRVAIYRNRDFHYVVYADSKYVKGCSDKTVYFAADNYRQKMGLSKLEYYYKRKKYVIDELFKKLEEGSIKIGGGYVIGDESNKLTKEEIIEKTKEINNRVQNLTDSVERQRRDFNESLTEAQAETVLEFQEDKWDKWQTLALWAFSIALVAWVLYEICK